MPVETVSVMGRIRKPLWRKLNPLWWFGNEDEQQLADAPWYMPAWPQWQRWMFWYYFRNPLQNFRCYVIGVADCNYTVTGKAPALCVLRSDLQPPQTGWQWSIIKIGLLRLPFVSYSGRVTFYIGWQPSGIAGVKLVFR